VAYIRAKVSVLVSAQLHALRLKRGWTQARFAQEADMRQSRVSAMEQPGSVNFNLETLVRSAATHGVGLSVKFVPFSEMLAWENNFNQESFNVTPINRDTKFLAAGNPPHSAVSFTWRPSTNKISTCIYVDSSSTLMSGSWGPHEHVDSLTVDNPTPRPLLVSSVEKLTYESGVQE
jgi:transcriptional regulator with XRE-family HTH domain